MKIISTRHFRPVTAALMLSLALACPAWASGSVEEILQRFVEDYRSDPMLVDATFGIEVGDERFHVTARRTESEPYEVELHEGFPEGGVWYYTLDDKTVLDMIDQRKLNAGTAMMKAFSTDETVSWAPCSRSRSISGTVVSRRPYRSVMNSPDSPMAATGSSFTINRASEAAGSASRRGITSTPTRAAARIPSRA